MVESVVGDYAFMVGYLNMVCWRGFMIFCG